MPNTVAEKIIEQLSELGVRFIYGIPGWSNLPIVEALRKEKKIKFILTRHEQTAAFMASAHAKLTGDIGVCLSIGGSGATNLITGLMDAATDQVPVLALTGKVDLNFLGKVPFQEINQIELFDSFTVFNKLVVKADQSINLLDLAVKKAYACQGVSLLSLPSDIMRKKVKVSILKKENIIFKNTLVSTDEEIKKFINCINESKRPIILGGWGIRDCGEAVLSFANKISAPIATTSRVKGVINENNSLSIGVLGSLGCKYTANIMKKADLLIIIGSGFRQNKFIPNIPIIQIDVDEAKLGKEFPIETGLLGDVKPIIEKINLLVKTKKPDVAFFHHVNKLKMQHQKEIDDDSRNVLKPIFPGFVIQAIKRNAKGNAIICVDCGDHTYWFYKKFICEDGKILQSANLSSMGFAFPAALAAQLDFPKEQVICIAGDGGFGMVMADFTTAVLYDLPIKVILFNDNKFKNVKKTQIWRRYKEFGTDLVNPNFSDFAKSCGGKGFRVDKPEELDKTMKQAFNLDKPVIVEIIVDREKLAPW